ncbi:hypothetical protein PIB30_067349 [Stylosanthes scabra]|uniref:Uncharacterized protein n=1 Tax=Stylosanthes scabra TaxID=79078 RepID=A0ABU6ZL88_9FABA|nr:hypothetical protein [Stylosanthes scabra]
MGTQPPKSYLFLFFLSFSFYWCRHRHYVITAPPPDLLLLIAPPTATHEAIQVQQQALPVTSLRDSVSVSTFFFTSPSFVDLNCSTTALHAGNWFEGATSQIWCTSNTTVISINAKAEWYCEVIDSFL